MRSLHRLIAATFALALFLLPATSFASVVTYDLGGNWAPLYGGGAFTGTLSFDTGAAASDCTTSAPGSCYANPNLNYVPQQGYYFPTGSLTIITEGHTFSTGPNNLAITADTQNSNYSVNVNNQSNTATEDGSTLGYVYYFFHINVPMANTDITPNFATTPDFSSGGTSYIQLSYGADSGSVSTSYSGHLAYFTQKVSTTPLPPALPLTLSGLALFGLLAWRRKRLASPPAEGAATA